MTEQITWTAIGDSFTEGTCDAPGMGGWVARAAQLLSEAGSEVRLANLAVHGAPIDSVLADQAAELPSRASIVSAIAGANDLLQLRLSVTKLRGSVFELIDRAAASGDLVLTSTCPDFFRQRFGPGSRLSHRVGILNDMVHEAVQGREDQIVVLDTYEILQSPVLWAADNVHPNELGHATLAEAAADLLGNRLRVPVLA